MYYISFIYLWLFYFLYSKGYLKDKRLILLPFIIIPILRFGVGSDYFSYQYLYDHLPITSLEKFLRAYPGTEIGFKILLFIGRYFGLPYHVFIGVLSLAVSLCLFYWVKENSENFGLSMITYYSLFYFAWNLNAIRQGLVMVLFSMLVLTKKEKSLLYEVGIVLVLSLFHVSILVVLPLLYLRRKEISPRAIIYIFIGSLLFNLLPFKAILLPFQDFKYLGKVFKYVDEIGGPFLTFATIMRLFLFLSVHWFYNRTYEKNSEFSNQILRFYLLGLSLYFLFKPIETLASRTSVYGYFLIILIIPLVQSWLAVNNIISKMFIVSVLIFSTTGVYKELLGASVQSGYKYSSHQLNFITIFNYDRHDFYNKFNLIYDIKDSSLEDFNDFFEKKEFKSYDLKEKNIDYLAVAFPNSKYEYGVIDEYGNIVEEPSKHYRPKIYGEYLEEIKSGGDYKLKKFRKIKTKEYVDESEVHEEILDLEANITRFNHFGFHKINGTLEDLNIYNHDYILEYVKEEDIDQIYKYDFRFPQEFQIIEIRARNRSLYLLNKVSNKDIQSKIYFKLSPYRGTSTFIGITEHTQEFINSNGEIIWIEEKK